MKEERTKDVQDRIIRAATVLLCGLIVSPLWFRAALPVAGAEAVQEAGARSAVWDIGRESNTVTARLGEDGELMITGHGEIMEFQRIPWEDCRTRITKVSIRRDDQGELMTDSMKGWFAGCIKLSLLAEDFEFPGGVSDISSLFEGCVSLNLLPEGMRIPDSVQSMERVFFVEEPADITTESADQRLRDYDWTADNRIFHSRQMEQAGEDQNVPEESREAPPDMGGGAKTGEETAQKARIFYYLNGGTNDAGNKDFCEPGQSITLKDPVKDGYAFAGWYTEAEFKNRITKISPQEGEGIVLYAKWNAVTSSVLSRIYQEIGKNNGSATFYFRIEKGKDFSGLVLPTWTVHGDVADQADIRWYEAVPVSAVKEGIPYNYMLTVKKQGHLDDYGPYTTHVYVRTMSGSLAFVGATGSYMLGAGSGYHVVSREGDGCAGWQCVSPVQVTESGGRWSLAAYGKFKTYTGTCGVCAAKGIYSDLYSHCIEYWYNCPHHKDVYLAMKAEGWCARNGGHAPWVGALNFDMTPRSHPVYFCQGHRSANRYTVVYAPNGGEGIMKSSSFVYDSQGGLRPNAFQNPGSDFLGWALEKEARVPAYKDKEVVKNLTEKEEGKVMLYAVWESNEHPVMEASRELMFYEGEEVTKEMLLEGVSAADKEDGELTADIRITGLKYADGKLSDGEKMKGEELSFDGDMPSDYMLDTWFLQMDPEASPVEHVITYEVTDQKGNNAVLERPVKVKYNEFPVITAGDRYFTLEEAQSGGITGDLFLGAALLDGSVRVADKEEDELRPDTLQNRLALLDFVPEEFQEFTDSGYIVLTYTVKDTMGPKGQGKEALCRFTVYVMRDGEIPPEPQVGNIRFINEKNYNKEGTGSGGSLFRGSLWYENSEYRSLITSLWRNAAPIQTWKFGSEDIQKAKAYIETHGIGNSRSENGLSGFIALFDGQRR